MTDIRILTDDEAADVRSTPKSRYQPILDALADGKTVETPWQQQSIGGRLNRLVERRHPTKRLRTRTNGNGGTFIWLEDR